ncbi:acyl-CoA reductase [Pullulanibacillus camelliae]|uniref:Acyl-CoA reductase n=1 Tax=Pullulanibacillus camelliae TaxID=1707096 RepID=A0A8J2YF45_9BACL|nr:acyl-CoA reductase [Pullulanibacillus camelliae]GGE40350.1 acyl-CoA reductase [Pullulanibacillus camelliae]
MAKYAEAEHIKMYKVPTKIRIDEHTEKIIETTDGNVVLQFPVLTGDKLREIGKEILKAQERYLSTLTVQTIVTVIDQAVQKWLDPEYPFRQLAEKLLPEITGYSKEMIRISLKRYMRTFRKKELLRFLDEEFDQVAMLDEFRPRKSGGLSRAFGPRLIFHIFSGNVPGVQLWSLIMGLLVKSAALGKTSSTEPLMAVLFSKTLAEIDPLLAEALAILPWKGGTASLETEAIELAEAVIVYGSNQTVERIKPKVPQTKRLLAYGHKISFAMIGKEALTPDRYYDVVHRLAEDIAMYDQQSCLSPQTIVVEKGGAITPKQFAQMLAAELQRFDLKWPRAELTDEEALAIHSVRHHYELEALNGQQCSVVYASSKDTAWTVIYHSDAAFNGSPLNRTVHICATIQLEAVMDILKPYPSYLQSCGLAVHPNRLLQLAALLGSHGVDRVTAIGEMNRAQAGWHHDGGLNLLQLVRFIDIESSAEWDAERYDPDVE